MKILLAEDDPVALEAISTCLRDDGFEVLSAEDGETAVEIWESQKPDLLCLDIMMPKLNGYDVCRRVRTDDARVPILFLSAKSEEIDVVVGLEIGADDFVRKPFGKRELLARIHAILRRDQPSPKSVNTPKQFALHDLTVYPRELRATRDGLSEIRLTPRELSILELLHSRPGEVVSRDHFFDHCWGLEYYPESRTLDQHIARLRKRIEHEPSEPEIIETVRGVGYRFGG